MVGKIDSSLGSAVVARSQTTKPENKTSVSNSTTTTAANHDTKTSLLERAMSVASNAPDIDMSRVEDIRNAIARGEFKIDPEATARAFIAMELSGS